MSESGPTQARIALDGLRYGNVSTLRFLTEGTAEAFAADIGAATVTFGDVTANKTIPYCATFDDGSQLEAEIGLSG